MNLLQRRAKRGIVRENSFRNGEGRGSSPKSSAETLARLMEDASDYRAAREHLKRVVLRGERSGQAKAWVERLEETLARMEKEKARLETKLRETRQ